MPVAATYHRFEPRDTMTGQVLGHYRLDAPLGAGGMGTVYRAYDTRLERTVAVKLLTAGSTDSASVLREARLASALNHPHICAVYEVAEAGDLAFIVMEFVDGQPLSGLIPPRGLPHDDLVRYGTQVADAIAHAHDRGVVHCDLKPQNIIITGDGRAKVLDFGIARRLQAAAVDATTERVGDDVDTGNRRDAALYGARSASWRAARCKKRHLGSRCAAARDGQRSSAVRRAVGVHVDRRDPGSANPTAARSCRTGSRGRR